MAVGKEGDPVLEAGGRLRRQAPRPPRIRDAPRLRRLQPGHAASPARRCGESVGANFDPSHLFWQGIDIESAIAEPGRAGTLHHFHAKDTGINAANTALNGVLDTTPMDQVATEGKRILTALRLARYEGALSIEHEDALFSVDEGFRKSAAFLRQLMPSEPPMRNTWWAR